MSNSLVRGAALQYGSLDGKVSSTSSSTVLKPVPSISVTAQTTQGQTSHNVIRGAMLKYKTLIPAGAPNKFRVQQCYYYYF